MLHPCRTALWALTVLLLVPVVLATLARGFGYDAGPVAYVVALTPWFAGPAVLCLVLAALSRSVVLLVVAGALVVVQGWWLAPVFVRDGGPDGSTTATVMTLNLNKGSADPDAVVRLVREHDVSVLALEELTPLAVSALRTAGLDHLLPHHFLRPADGFTGTGLWSRTPLRAGESLPGYTSEQLLARTEVGGRPVTVAALHPIAPGPFDGSAWKREYEQLARDLAEPAGPLLVLGDLNATRDHVPFQQLSAALDVVDAADQAGAGLAFTFPYGRRVPAAVAIDHVLVRGEGVRASALHTAQVPDSDHAALLVTLSLP